MEPRDLGRVVTVGDPAISPDGSAVAVVVSRVDLEANCTRSTLWLVTVDGGAARPLTSGDTRDDSPRWSPDGSRLAFTRSVPGAEPPCHSLQVLPIDGPGEAVTVTRSSEAIESIDWSPDGQRLAWCGRVTAIKPGTADRDRPPRQITTLVWSLDDVGWTVDRRTQVHVADATAGAEVRTVTAGPFDHRAVRWSPDGRRLVFAAGRHDTWDLDEVVDLWLVDADAPGDTPAEPERLTDHTRAWSHPSWSPDGSKIAALAREVETGWRNTRPIVVEVDGGAEVDLAPGFDRTFAPFPGERAPIWVDEGAAVLLANEDRGRVVVQRLDPTGVSPPKPLTSGDQVVNGFDAAAGVLATVVGDATHPAELEVGDVRTTFTAEFVAACPARPVERFTVPSPAGDDDIDAWLITPDGWTADGSDSRRWPLLVAVHGGPMSQYGERWFDEFQLLTGAGFVVVASNPHGSSGRDDAWARAIRSPKAAIEPGTGWGGIDADDVLAVLDATLERWPALDPARVGVLGGSYGGYMTSWLLARTDRFAAGCSERAVNNLLSEEWSSDVGGSFHRELGITHLDDPDEYVRMSPVTYVRDLTAPILILHSENDLRCPTEQADALFTALRMLRHPDVEYWRFPGEGHEMSRSGAPAHRIRRAELINAFFERTLGSGPR